MEAFGSRFAGSGCLGDTADMRWLTFAVMAVICVTLHTTLGPRLAVGGVRPDWILVLVVFFAMHVRSADVITAGWILGLIADFQTDERFGVLSLVYASVAAVVYLCRGYLFRAHPLAHLAMTFGGGMVAQLLLLGYYGVFAGFGGGSWVEQLLLGTLVAIYSALWAPLVHAGMLKFSRWFGFDVPRYSHKGLARVQR